jgi:glycosyltransferase involved in cell wall biosynthesis
VRFSIIIPTISRVKEPLAMLNSLLLQKEQNFEVFIIDQNEEDILSEKLKIFKNKLAINHFRIDVKGASNARNFGIKKAKGEILLFPDDDCEFHTSYLDEIDQYFLNNNIDGIVTTTKDKNDGKAISILMASKPQKITRKNVLKTVIEAGIIVKSSKLNTTFFDGNMGVGTSSSPYWSDEGPDLVLRLLNQGLHFNYCPQFYMFHPNPVKVYNQKTAIRSYRYGKGRGYFLRKHNYGLHQISYYLLIYIVGMLKGLVSFNKKMFLYFKQGFKGRYEGYFLS